MAPRPGFSFILCRTTTSPRSEELEIPYHFQDPSQPIYAPSVYLRRPRVSHKAGLGVSGAAWRGRNHPRGTQRPAGRCDPPSPYLRPVTTRYPRPRAEKAWLWAPSDFRRGVMTTERQNGRASEPRTLALMGRGRG